MNRTFASHYRRGAAYSAPLAGAALLLAGAMLCMAAGSRPHLVAGRRQVDATSARLAWVSHGWLYAAAVGVDGQPAPGRARRRICPTVSALWETTYDGIYRIYPGSGLRVSPTGTQVSIVYRGAISPGSDSDAALWLVDMRPGSTPCDLGRGYEPCFSPDGRYLVFTGCGDGNGPRSDPAVRILDLQTGQIRTFRDEADWPCWSPDGREIALTDERDPPDRGMLIVDARTRGVHFRWSGINPINPIFSPDGKFIAIDNHISRPQIGHCVIDRRSADPVKQDFTPSEYLPGNPVWLVPDGRWLLWDWSHENPKNDGLPCDDNVGLTSADGRVKRLIGVGTSAAFAPDGEHVLWLQPRHPGAEPDEAKNPFDLMWRDIHGGKSRRLIADVEAFAVTPGLARRR